MRVALLGFLPWIDASRGTDVRENPAAISAEMCARELDAAFVPIEVSGKGIVRAMEAVRLSGAEVVVAVGQTSTGPRVERFGKVPGVWAPATDDEAMLWEIAPDAQAIADRLNTLHDPAAETELFVASEDAGGYFCDHLCVELGREMRQRSIRARFLHVTAIDGCLPPVRDARIRMYAKQIAATVEWITAG